MKEKLNWHMTLDEVELDVAGKEKSVVMTIAYRDKFSLVEKEEAQKKGFIARIMVPEESECLMDKPDECLKAPFSTWEFPAPIVDLSVAGGEMYVLFRDELRIRPVHDCSDSVTCESCIASVFPSCGWCPVTAQCTDRATCAKPGLANHRACNMTPLAT